MDKVTVEKIVDYSFERNEKSNVLAIHQTRPLIAYLINIQRTPKLSKGWSNGTISNTSNTTPLANQSIRIIDYDTRQRCLAKGVYHSRPADCVFSINSDVIKLAVVDRSANVYLYDVAYFINELTATRIAVIRGPEQEISPYDDIILVWCPFVPCEDFDDGDGGLRLALAMNTKIEIFAVDRLQGKTGDLQRRDLHGAYKSIENAHESNIVTLSISPDCSTISAAASDNRVTFFSSDIDNEAQRCIHNWEASITDKSSISKLFFLDDYPKLLADSSMKFWGNAFIGTRNGQMLLVDLRTWSVYQRTNIPTDNSVSKHFDYRIDSTSRHVVALNGNQCYVIQIEHVNNLPRIVKTTTLSLNNPIYSFVLKQKSDCELELFTISAYSLERYIINVNTVNAAAEQVVEDLQSLVTGETRPNVDVAKMDRLVESLFTNLNLAFSQGLEEFLNDIKSEINDLKSKLNGLSRDVRKVHQQLQDVAHHK